MQAGALAIKSCLLSKACLVLGGAVPPGSAKIAKHQKHRKKRTMMHATSENIILNERSSDTKAAYGVIPFLCNIQNGSVPAEERESGWVVARGGVGGRRLGRRKWGAAA